MLQSVRRESSPIGMSPWGRTASSTKKGLEPVVATDSRVPGPSGKKTAISGTKEAPATDPSSGGAAATLLTRGGAILLWRQRAAAAACAPETVCRRSVVRRLFAAGPMLGAVLLADPGTAAPQ